MKSARRTLPFVLMLFVLITVIVLTTLPQTARAATVHDVSTPEGLAVLLGSVPGGDTIRLEADINYNTANPGIDNILVTGRAITFDLNGHKLNVTTATGHGLEVGGGGIVNMVDSVGNGEFNVRTTASEDVYYGVYAHDGGQATVTNAEAGEADNSYGAYALGPASQIEVKDYAGGDDGAVAENGGVIMVGGDADGFMFGARAEGDGSRVEVTGDVSSGSGDGAFAGGGGVVTVGGDVDAMCVGAQAAGSGSSVEVTGNVTSGDGTSLAYGVQATGGGSVKVYGYVSVNGAGEDGDGSDTFGVYVAGSGSTVSIDGNLTVSGMDGAGISATNAGTATIEGDVAVNGENMIGVYVSGSDSEVEVEGDVTSSYRGVEARDYGTVTVDGDVTVDGEGTVGVSAADGSEDTGTIAFIYGNVTVHGENAIGVSATDGGRAAVGENLTVSGTGAAGIEAKGNYSVASIGGRFTAPEGSYILLNDRHMAAEDGEEGEGYLVYLDGVSAVYVVVSLPVCAIGAATYDTLGEALATVGDGEAAAIKLLRDIDYNTGIEVVGKTVIFDLNGHTLNVTNSAGHGLAVGASGVVSIAENDAGGAFNVDSRAETGYGVYAHDGGQATVTIASGVQGGVYAVGGASVHVKDVASGEEYGVSAAGGGTVTVDGEIYKGDGKPYILLEGAEKLESDGLLGTGDYENYLIYSDANSNLVRVKSKAVCKIGTILYNTLDAALRAVEEGAAATIRLLADIDSDTGILITGRTVTFDLNGHTLDVVNADGHGLEVGSGGVVAIADTSLAGDGEFNVTSTKSWSYGVYAYGGGQAKVTSATATGEGSAGTFAYGSGSRIEVTGDVKETNDSYGVWATDGGRIEVGGDVEGNTAVMVSDTSSSVEVVGDVTSPYLGVQAQNQGTATVHGNVTVDGANSIGVLAIGGATATIEGDVTVSGTNSIGVQARDEDSKITIDGTLTVPNKNLYIVLNSDPFAAADGELVDGYLVYDDGTSTVYIKPYTGPICSIGATGYATLDEALAVASGGAETTIKLLRNIDYNTGIEVVDKTVVFDLNGHTLTVMNTAGNGLTVGAGGVMDITDTSVEGKGEFIAGSYAYGVYAHDGGQATVTYAMGMQAGVYAASSASVHVKGIAAGMVACVLAADGSTVTIDGGIQVMGDGGVYISLDESPKLETDGVLGTGTDEGYFIYSDGSSNVRVKSNKVCKIGTTLYTLGDALEAVEEGTEATITLLKDIEYDAGIEVEGRTIIFDLNGHTLNVTASEGSALEVGTGGIVDITGEGEFNVTSNAESGYGVYAHDGGQATVTGTAATGSGGIGVYVSDSGSTVEVEGHVTSSYRGVEARNYGTVTVGGDVTADGAGAVGVFVNYGGAEEGSTATVYGNVTVNGDDAVGVSATGGGRATVKGNLTVSGEGAIGIESKQNYSTVYIEGKFTAPDEEDSYIILYHGSIAAADGEEEGEYLVYTDGASAVYIRENLGPECAIGETEYDELDEALDMAGAGETTTIRLLRDVDYEGGIEVIGKTVIFDLNGYVLYVDNEDGNGLTVGGDGVVDIIDADDEYCELYFQSTSESYYGVYAYDGGRATVGSAGGMPGGAVYAKNGAVVRVKDMAFGYATCVRAEGGSTVTVDGKAIGYTSYITLEEIEKLTGDGVLGTGDYTNYLVYFDDNGNVVRVRIPGTDATLSGLTVGGNAVAGFAADIYSYSVKLPYGTLPGSDAAQVGATVTDIKAAVNITQASALPGSATVVVTAEDGETELTYTVNFTLGAPDATGTVTLTSAGHGTVTGGGTYDLGQRVSLSVTPASGYMFDGWYAGESRVSFLPNYAFTVEGDIALTAKFRVMPENSVEITIEGSGTFRLNSETTGRTEYGDRQTIGEQITLTATPDPGNVFVYWQDSRSGSIISTDPVYTFFIGTDVSLKAIFNRTADDATSTVTVIFKDKNGRILKSSEVEKNGAATAPASPSLPGYNFVGWDQAFDHVTADMIVNARYERVATTYTLTVVGGTFLSSGETEGSFQYDMPVMVKADTAPEGQKFSHWNQDGVKISSSSTYSFFTPMQATTLTAVFVPVATVLVEAPFITLSGEVQVDKDGKYMLFIANRSMAPGYTLIESGILLLPSATEPTGEITVDTANVICGKIKNDSTDQFYIRKNDIAAGATWYARAYLICRDSSGNIITIYSDNTVNRTME